MGKIKRFLILLFNFSKKKKKKKLHWYRSFFLPFLLEYVAEIMSPLFFSHHYKEGDKEKIRKEKENKKKK